MSVRKVTDFMDRHEFVAQQQSWHPLLDLFNNSVSCQTSLPIFQAKALQNRGFLAVVV
jgi:hypothetical protein